MKLEFKFFSVDNSFFQPTAGNGSIMIILLGWQPGHQSESGMGIYAGWGAKECTPLPSMLQASCFGGVPLAHGVLIRVLMERVRCTSVSYVQ